MRVAHETHAGDPPLQRGGGGAKRRRGLKERGGCGKAASICSAQDEALVRNTAVRSPSEEYRAQPRPQHDVTVPAWILGSRPRMTKIEKPVPIGRPGTKAAEGRLSARRRHPHLVTLGLDPRVHA